MAKGPKIKIGEAPKSQSRNSIEDIWGPRTPYVHEWPVRVDEAKDEDPEKWVQSACVMCSNGCGLDIGVKDGKVVGVRGRGVDRVNKGRLGPKGLHAWKAIGHEDRLKYPQIRRNGKLERATWDEAMSLIVEKSKKTIEKLTSHGIAFYTTGQFFLEEYYVLAMVGKAGLNTLHMDGNTRLCTATAAASMRESFGSDGQPGSYTDIDFTDCIMLSGHNMAATQTVLWTRILDRLAGPKPPKIIVVDPRLSETAKLATVHLKPKIGTNVALFNGIQHLLFENDWVDYDWVEKHTIGLDVLKSTVKGCTPQVVEEITGVPAADLYKAAEIIGTTRTLLSTALQGIYQSSQATAAACQINNINLLRGMIGRQGCGIFQMNGQPTAQNNREAGCDGEFPGFRNHLNPLHMNDLARLWNIDPIKVPHWSEPTHIENILSFIAKGTIEMLWISGTNPLVSLPNSGRIRELLTKDDLFVIAQDIYPTETTAIADVVLPGAQWGEKTGCFTNVDRTVHISYKAVEPPGEARPDLDIFLDYGKRMEFKDKDGNDLLPFKESEEVFEAWKKVSEGRPCDYSGMSYEKLTGGSGLQWPCNKDAPFGTERLFADGKFFTEIDYCESFGHDLETGASYSKDEYKALNPAGRAILKACPFRVSSEEPNDEYPLRLSTGRRVHHFHTRTKTGRTPLQNTCPSPEIEISTEDARTFGVEDGEEVLVESVRGKVQLPVRVGGIEPCQTFIPFHFGYFDSTDGKARAANELTTAKWDPISKQPMFKGGAIKITKLPKTTGEVQIHAPEQQSAAIARAERKPSASKVASDAPRRRGMERWLGELEQCSSLLLNIFTDIIERNNRDPDVQNGLRIMHDFGTRMYERIKPMAEKYQDDKDWGKRRAHTLAETLFFKDDQIESSYLMLETLQSLHVYLSYIKGNLRGMYPAAQALWDPEFIACVQECSKDVARMEEWVLQQLQLKAPQTLVVPLPVDNGQM
ncbi:nitrate reductase [Plenodomus tracheiphilus IPT5]|uniref:Nitrate reductase n=1 Tax=Plenodomus tracheiphilus IPT5 TaxID=1408161 RepID=A0A6A7BNV1_9PLEO|nr:nitrate reductase [Plenodomus tracheiphilus IPT5]